MRLAKLQRSERWSDVPRALILFFPLTNSTARVSHMLNIELQPHTDSGSLQPNMEIITKKKINLWKFVKHLLDLKWHVCILHSVWGMMPNYVCVVLTGQKQQSQVSSTSASSCSREPQRRFMSDVLNSLYESKCTSRPRQAKRMNMEVYKKWLWNYLLKIKLSLQFLCTWLPSVSPHVTLEKVSHRTFWY